MKESGADNEDAKELDPRKNLEEEYLDYEAKVKLCLDNVRTFAYLSYCYMLFHFALLPLVFSSLP